MVPPERGGRGSGGARPVTFSVVIAAYQAAGVVGDAIDSALRQTYPPLEVVVCDDGSTDGTGDVVARYGPPVVLVRQDNSGEAAAKNQAAARARGDFVVILDADDVFAPDRLAAFAALAEARPDLDIMTSDAWLELDGTAVRRCYSDEFRFETADQRREILRRNFVFGLAAVRRSSFSAAGGFDESIRRTCDWELWIRMILAGARVGLVAEPLASYRVSRTSLSADRIGMARGGLLTLERAAAQPGLDGADRAALADGVRRERAKLVEREARRALGEGTPDVRRRLLDLARTSGVDPALRAKAAVAALLPRVAAGRLRPGPEWTGAGGLGAG